ncbi:transporter substrate-binding domain-containing protein [Enterobacter asburiae]|uniref:ATP-binding protein n=1 Tax=Scandinavium sp. UTDF21-P1B TaxID=3446379 RepID=UPI0034866182
MRIASWLLLLIFTFNAHVAQANEALKLLARSQEVLADPGLTPGEWRWVREHRKLRLAVWRPMSPPYDITTGLNDYGGINADFLGLTADSLGLEIDVIRYPDYAAALAALRERKADFIAQAGENQRQDGLLLSTPYSPNEAVEVVNTDAPRDEAPVKIAVASTYDGAQVLARYPNAQIVSFYSARHALEALAFRQIDLFFCDEITARYLVSQSNLSNLRIRSLTRPYPTQGFSFAVMPESKIWITVLNKVLKAVPESAGVEIHRRWNGGIPLSLSEQQPVYTSLERKWIQEHNRIRVAVAQDNGPVAWFDESGQLRGIIADILTALRLRTGLVFEIQRYPGQRAALAAVKEGKADLVAGGVQDDIWRADLITTRTWLYNSWVMVGRRTHAQAALNRAVVSLDGQSPDAWLRQQSAELNLKAASWRQGLERVVRGESDMMTMPLIVANTLLDGKEYPSLHILASIDIDPMRYSFGASRQSWPLITILNKALINIPPEDLHALTRGGSAGNGFTAVSAPSTSGGLLLLLCSAVMLLLVPIVWFCRRQQRLMKMLREAKRHADEASQAKSAFLITMSHEIRTPVSAILGMLELVMKRPGDAQQNARSVQVAWDAAQSLLLLIGNILDVSRIEAGRLVLRPERVALRGLIEEAALLFEGMASRKGLTFVLEIDADIQGDVLADRSRLRQILVNLAGNAIKYTDRGQVTLRVESAGREDDYQLLRMDVEDTGPGIDDVTRERLFQPFVQGDDRHVAQGSGMGLYICRSLAQMMGGSVVLHSEPGKGTRVTVMLRLPLMAALTSPGPQPQEEKHSGPLSVLVVDDNPAGRMLLIEQLRWLGHRASGAETSAQALASVEAWQPDAIITDCNMPGMNGFELVSLLVARWPEIAIYGVTADARDVVREAGRKAGMRDCLFKPITLSVLSGLLGSVTAPEPAVPTFSWSGEPDLPPALLEGENLNVFLSLQLSVLDETLHQLTRWHHDQETPLRETLHKLRGGIQLLGVDGLLALCEAQEQAPNSEGIHRLEAQIRQLRAMLIQWRETGLQPQRTVLQRDEDGSVS